VTGPVGQKNNGVIPAWPQARIEIDRRGSDRRRDARNETRGRVPAERLRLLPLTAAGQLDAGS
jgi:hypothetical protein